MSSRPKNAVARPAPRLYLVTPPVNDAQAFAPQLDAAMAAGDVAAVLLRLAEADERSQINCVKRLASIVQDKEAALLLDGRAELVARAGADGAHLSGIDAFNDAREILKPERIAGAGGLDTRHDAMLAAEQGADYVMFGEPDANGRRADFEVITERIAWWAEVFEAPCVAFAAAVGEIAPLVRVGADFIALGDWIWADPRGVSVCVAEAVAHLTLEGAT